MFILLDIDGVMIPAAGWKTPENLEDGFPMFSVKAVEALSNLLKKDAEVVLTTSHKMRFTLNEWRAIFEKRGIKITRLSRLDSNTNGLRRRDELLAWLNNRGIEGGFVIIDDDTSLHGLPEHLKRRWIKTSALVGLTPGLVSEANFQMKDY